MKPVVSQLVNVVTHVGIREGQVIAVFEAPDPRPAPFVNFTDEEFERLHGMRATISVKYGPEDGISVPFVVANMEYDAKAERLGTWSFQNPAYDTAPDAVVAEAVDVGEDPIAVDAVDPAAADLSTFDTGFVMDVTPADAEKVQ